jgi:hypothetical protein
VLTDDPICERCLEEDESANLCDCEAVAHVRFRHLGQFFMEPSEYYEAAIDKVLQLIRGVGLIIERGSTIVYKGRGAKASFMAHSCTYIPTYY